MAEMKDRGSKRKEKQINVKECRKFMKDKQKNLSKKGRV
jgi:hypothetical protein